MISNILLSELLRDQATIVKLMINDFYLSMMLKTLSDARIEFLLQHRFDLTDVILEMMDLKSSPNYSDIKESYLKRIEENVDSFLQFPSLVVEELVTVTYLEVRKLNK